MDNRQNSLITAPSLPKGGGAIQGMGDTLTVGGPTGMATLSIPLPISAGRGTAPALALNYSSGSGNSAFGIGWQCASMAIRRRTSHGVPRYQDKDSFLSPDGEVMNRVADDQGNPVVRHTDQLLGTALAETWQVIRYQPRILRDFSRLEYWLPGPDSEEKPFWVMFSPDGQVSLFGKNAHARVASPADDNQISEWLLEESVTLSCEHIYYHYQAEDDVKCSQDETEQHPLSGAKRYLRQVSYGNIKPKTEFFALDNSGNDDQQWLFYLLFDYGERAADAGSAPAFAAGESGWAMRPDPFSRFDYGFEIRTRRLCRQILTFHRLQALEGPATKSEVPALVARLILEYALDPCVTTLIAVHRVAHEPDGALISLPPLLLGYQHLETNNLPDWQPMPQLETFNYQQPWQFVDLYGEGLPGILYQDIPGAWWYRAPQRDREGKEPNGVTWGEITPLPRIPAQQQQAMLMDINGDGQLDWIITSAGVNGYHTLHPDGQWSPLIPLSALPTEYFHPLAQLANLTGAGLPDLVMIGPRSVRLYANQETGWGPAQTVIQADGITLPLPNRDARKLVAFADMLGSGQQHLVEISVDSVRCWPSQGHGRFGAPVTLPGFSLSAEEWDPDRVWLADMDGSGTCDILYAQGNTLLLFINESGNRFSASVTISLPDGVTFDRSCRLSIADTQGLGVSSIILTVPHRMYTHWRLDVTKNKPWLLHTIHNQMGANTTLFYRSSAQFWLDEKQNATETGQRAISYLPFPMPLLWRKEVADEISGNRITSLQNYAHGAWDGREREFRGFGRVVQTDTDCFAMGSDNSISEVFPSRTVSWFATGCPETDGQFAAEYWQGDNEAWPVFNSRFSTYDGTLQQDVALTPSAEEAYWLHRALKGQLLHSELYGEDNSPQSALPYTVSDHRHQVRRLPGIPGEEPAAWTSEIESCLYHYERVATDPQCSQQVVLACDAWGCVTDSLTIAYPRRPEPEETPYPESLPLTLFTSSFDEQQRQLRLTRSRQTWHHLTDDNRFMLGIADVSRSDAWEYAAEKVPQQGITLETLSAADSLIAAGTPYVYLGHQRIVYTDYSGPDGPPAWPPLVAWRETAELDQQALTAFTDVLTQDELVKLLATADYHRVMPPLHLGKESAVWVARRGYTDYQSMEHFYRPQAQRETLLTGKTTIIWDTHDCVITALLMDAAGLSTTVAYDYRFMTQNHIIDQNDNHKLITFDALGRLTSYRFWGQEQGKAQGYTPPNALSGNFSVPPSVEAALALSSGIPVAQCLVYNSSSWMTMAAPESAPDKKTPPRLPPHVLIISTDRYDGDPLQQLRQTVTFSDGFGRLLQSSLRYEPGEAWQRAEDGSLVTDEKGELVITNTDTRWVVSGRSEYDGKGQLVRTFQPYFLNSWQYVSDDSARKDLYADRHYYDALGRERQVITAKGWLRRNIFTPWFVVKEDENDTASEIRSGLYPVQVKDQESR